MLSLSTTWNFARHGRLTGAVVEAEKMGFAAVELRAKGAVPDPAEGAERLLGLGLRCPSVHAPLTAGPWSDGDPSCDLAAIDESRRGRAVAAVLETLPLAAAVRAGMVVVHLGHVEVADAARRQDEWLAAVTEGRPLPEDAAAALAERGAKRDGHLLAAAKSLFDLTRAAPGVTFAFEGRLRFHEIPSLEEVEHLLSDASGRRVAYWHDTGHAHLLSRIGVADSLAWLDRYGGRTAGIHLHDVLGAVDHLPPGGGEVDWAGVRGYIGSGMIRTLEVNERHSPKEVLGAVSFLSGLGLR